MSSGIKRPPPPNGPARRGSTNPPGSSPSLQRSPSRTAASATQKSTLSNGASPGRPNRGLGATASTTARAATQRTRSDADDNGVQTWSETMDDDARAERAGLIEDLKERLQKAEAVAEHHQRQTAVTQSRLDDALREQAKLEENLHEVEERADSLDNEKREVVRQRRELESIYETERVAAMEERERVLAREEDLQNSIQRLKELLAQKDVRSGTEDERRLSRTPSFRSNSSSNIENGHFAPPAPLQRSTSENSSKLLLQKDKVIESLRLELAEAQIKLVEVENMGGGRLQELERILLETRMANARLMEDNESFQLLLSEKTLNGDFSKGEFMRASSAPDERVPSRSGPSTSLADELQSAASDTDNEAQRRLEAEVGSLKDQNKALTLYINSIIERLLNHKEFESILDKTPNLISGIAPPRSNVDKDLPPPPDKGSVASSLLQRARSVAKVTARPKPTPTTHTQVHTSPEMHTANEDPISAPSIPLRRSQSNRMSAPPMHHRRTSLELAGAAAVVNNMYRGPPPVPTSGQMSPGLVSPRNSFFGQLPTSTIGTSASGHPTRSASNTPVVSESIAEEVNPISNTHAQGDSEADDKVGIDTPSPPRSVAAFGLERANSVMAGNKVRPLRLVQESVDAQADQAARNKANRGSWMAGWFTRGKPEDDSVPKRSFSGEASGRGSYG